MAEPLFRDEPLTGPVAVRLITALNAELRERYPNPLDTHWDLREEEVAPEQGRFLVAYLEEQAVGCGAVRRIEPRVGELKRMYVIPAHRGEGIGRALVRQLETVAVSIGIDRVVLETGETFEVRCGSSGGLGDPLDRDPSLVVNDVAVDRITRDDATAVYGVVIDDDGHVDAAATEARRTEMRSGRLARATAPVRAVNDDDGANSKT